MTTQREISTARTRTGNFPIGFRRGGSAYEVWQSDLDQLLVWAASERFGVIDLGNNADRVGAKAIKAGFRLGSIDLVEWSKMISPDKATRQAAVERNVAYIKACGALGPMNHFVVMLPEKPELKRAENFAFMVESYGQLASTLEEQKAKIVIEGWPGPGALCCTPESYGAFFRECSSPAFGVNYDPSHLIRMGIDPVRFLREFAPRVHHVHGKDTELIDEALYLYGNLQEPTLGQPHAFGEMCWRYTLPGHGCARWTEIFRVLADAGYAGAVSIELEDENFNGTVEGEKSGLLSSRSFLEGC